MYRWSIAVRYVLEKYRYPIRERSKVSMLHSLPQVLLPLLSLAATVLLLCCGARCAVQQGEKVKEGREPAGRKGKEESVD
ncbi:hypothetical protein EJB05_09384, partial [Eragrostis curvula]